MCPCWKNIWKYRCRYNQTQQPNYIYLAYFKFNNCLAELLRDTALITSNPRRLQVALFQMPATKAALKLLSARPAYQFMSNNNLLSARYSRLIDHHPSAGNCILFAPVNMASLQWNGLQPVGSLLLLLLTVVFPARSMYIHTIFLKTTTYNKTERAMINCFVALFSVHKAGAMLKKRMPE